MVDAGELIIRGALTVDDIESGLDRVTDQIEDMETQTKQLNATTRETKNLVGSTTKFFIGLGIAGTAAITALAVKSPALAGTMAKISVQTLKLSNIIGRELRPIFETIANDLIPSIGQAFSNNEVFISNVVDTIVELVEAVGSLITLDWEGLIEHLDKVALVGGGIAVGGAVGGLPGAAVGGAIGLLASSSLFDEKAFEKQKEGFESGTARGILQGVGASTAVGAQVLGELQKEFLKFLLSFLGNAEDKKVKMASPNGVGG